MLLVMEYYIINSMKMLNSSLYTYYVTLSKDNQDVVDVCIIKNDFTVNII